MQILPVIFRTDRDGETTAIFPTICEDHGGRLMRCYSHVGQHGTCSREWMLKTRGATAEETRDLLRELRGIYAPDRLEVRQRITPQMRREFMASFYAGRDAVKRSPEGRDRYAAALAAAESLS